MSDQTITSQAQIAADQCRVVAHFAQAISDIYTSKASIVAGGEASSLHAMWIEHTDAMMETLGNILNGMDAVTDEDAWTFPIVRASVERLRAQSEARV